MKVLLCAKTGLFETNSAGDSIIVKKDLPQTSKRFRS